MHMILKIIMRSFSLRWSTLHVINTYVDNVCTCEDDKNTPKENLSPPLPVTYPKIYPTIVPGIIIYVNTSHLIIIFVDVVHAYESHF